MSLCLTTVLEYYSNVLMCFYCPPFFLGTFFYLLIYIYIQYFCANLVELQFPYQFPRSTWTCASL